MSATEAAAADAASPRPLKIFIVAGEHSGDALGAKLMAALKQMRPDCVTFAGAGGVDMKREGLASLFAIEDVAVMGPLSSVFDFITFGGLLFVFNASPEEFRTVWFLESMATQILVIFIIRTNGRPWRNFPRPILAATSLAALLAAMALPFTPAGSWFGFVVPPAGMLGGVGAIVLAYLLCAELLKPMAVGSPRQTAR